MKCFFSIAILVLIVYFSGPTDSVDVKYGQRALSKRHPMDVMFFNPDLTVDEILRLICMCIKQNVRAASVLQSLADKLGLKGLPCEDIIRYIFTNPDKITGPYLTALGQLVDLILDCLIKNNVIINTSGLTGVELAKAMMVCIRVLIGCKITFNPKLYPKEILDLICKCIEGNDKAKQILVNVGERYGCYRQSCVEILQCLAQIRNRLSADALAELGEMFDLILDCLFATGVITDVRGLSGADLAVAILDCLAFQLGLP